MTTQETMTIHEALSEIKLTEKKIVKATQALIPCAAVRAGSANIDGVPRERFAENARSCYQKIIDLMRRCDALKRAVSQSNASTTITAAGRTMTVAEAIYQVKKGRQAREDLIYTLDASRKRAEAEIRVENGDKLEKRLDQLITGIYGAGSGEQADPEAVAAAREAFWAQNVFEFFDPLDIAKKIEELTGEGEELAAKIDAALQVSNAVTRITVEY